MDVNRLAFLILASWLWATFVIGQESYRTSIGPGPAGYSVQTIDTPKEARSGLSGLDVNEAGGLYVATRWGEVWHRSKAGEWTLFATGLHEPTGLICESDGSLVVAQKPELTRLVDSDGDGQADEYRCLASGWSISIDRPQGLVGPVKDRWDNFYGTVSWETDSRVDWRSLAYRIDAEGGFQAYALGRAVPTGMGLSPSEEIFLLDHPEAVVSPTRISLLYSNGLLGLRMDEVDGRDTSVDDVRAALDGRQGGLARPPVVWFPTSLGSEIVGNLIWDTTKGLFGPFRGQIFVSGREAPQLFRVSLQNVDGVYQGMVIPFLAGFQAGNACLKFDERSGALWVGQEVEEVGGRGDSAFGLQKVVWDGTHPFEIHDILLTDTGFNIRFTEELNPQYVKRESISVFAIDFADLLGVQEESKRSLVAIESVSLLLDRKTIALKAPLAENRVYEFDVGRVRSVDGRIASNSRAFYTLDRLVSSRR